MRDWCWLPRLDCLVVMFVLSVRIVEIVEFMEFGPVKQKTKRFNPREISAKKISQGKRLTGLVGQAG